MVHVKGEYSTSIDNILLLMFTFPSHAEVEISIFYCKLGDMVEKCITK